ncbi:MAG TPA: PEP-CTERM sorting domain-containing protein, partial [Telluria sp.]|nr:PEP-CTERM sorting domain-containing protein [Telluria sp.]
RTRIPLPRPRVLAGGAFAFVALVTAWVWPAAPERERAPSMGMAPAAAARSAAVLATARPAKVVYRNSVLPGGVGSSAELRFALAHDPVAAAHYAGFNVAAARKVQVERSRMAHVSYRIGDKIYWTRKPVRLALGETLLSDGEHLVRGRCGNRIADEPQGPVLQNEPAPEVLEMAYVSAEPLIDEPSDLAPSADLAAATAPADARQATRPRSTSPFAPALDPAVQSPPVTYAPTRILAFNATPGTGGPARAPLPTPDSPAKTPPPGSPPPPTMPAPPSRPRPTVPQAPTPIPEPGSAALLGLGLAVLLLMRVTTRRRAALGK